MQRDLMFHHVYEALDRDRCAICHVSVEAVEKYLWTFLYEGVNDPWFREVFIDARGFCPVHAWRLPAFHNSATGVAIVYRHLLQEFLDAFASQTERAAVGSGGRRWRPWGTASNVEAARGIERWQAPRVPCPACRAQWLAEDRYVAAAGRGLADRDFRSRYEASMGLCIRHLSVVFDQTPETDLEWLVRTERGIIEGLIHELSEFWRKHDYRFHHEPWGTEGSSWRRVLSKMAGVPGMVWRQ
jgi:hypothetical protein